MQQDVSTRIDKELYNRIAHLAKAKKIAEKDLIEEALRKYLDADAELNRKRRILRSSFGAWQREESAEETRSLIRSKFNESFERRRGLREDDTK